MGNIDWEKLSEEERKKIEDKEFEKYRDELLDKVNDDDYLSRDQHQYFIIRDQKIEVEELPHRIYFTYDINNVNYVKMEFDKVAYVYVPAVTFTPILIPMGDTRKIEIPRLKLKVVFTREEKNVPIQLSEKCLQQIVEERLQQWRREFDRFIHGLKIMTQHGLTIWKRVFYI